MRTKRVTETWEYYRDNCSGFKEPMRKRFRELDEYVAGLEELCGDLFDRLMDKDEICGECRSQCDYDAWNFGADGCIYKQRMDELGIPRQ